MDRDRRRKARLTAPGFLVLSSDVVQGRVVLRGEESRHAFRVCRCRPGDRIEATDGAGMGYRCRVVSCSSERTEAEILDRLPERGEARMHLILAVAPVKGERFDWLVEKAVEVGAAEILPTITVRTVVEAGGRQDRWRRVAVAALKQARRSRLLRIAEPRPFPDVLAELAARVDLLLLAWEGEDASSDLSQCLPDPPVASVGLLVGPEGGFTDEEVAAARSFGASPFSLGPRRLRTETAAIVSAALVLHEMEGRRGRGP